MSDVKFSPSRRALDEAHRRGHPKRPAPPAPKPAPPTPPAAPASLFRRVILLDHAGSGAPNAATLDRIALAMTKGMLRDFFPAYGKGAVFIVGATKDVTSTDRVLGLFKDPDQPGALGYHDLSPHGVPYGKVFPLLDAQDGANLSTTIDHEGKELTEDDTIDLSRTGSDGAFWADEPCDAVEQDEYEIDGVKLSNFVYPAWYSGVETAGLPGGKFDFLGKLSAPLSVDAGGYAQFFDPQRGWQQITHDRVKPRRYRRTTAGRIMRRVRRAMAPIAGDAAASSRHVDQPAPGR